MALTDNLTDYFQFPAGCDLFSRWQSGDEAARQKLKALFDAAIKGEFDAAFRDPAPANSVCVTTSLHLMTLTVLNQLYGWTSAQFYKGDSRRFLRTTLMTQRLLGINKLTLGWPVYAFGAEAVGQAMMYPDQHAPGADPGEPMLNHTNMHVLRTPDFDSEIPRVIEEMLHNFSELTGLEPVVHLPAPYSFAADIFGQEEVIAAMYDEPEFVVDLLDRLTDEILVPWCERLTRKFQGIWLELSDASGSPLFIGPSLFQQIAALPIQRLISDFPWGDRIYVANYRGDVTRKAASGGRDRKGGGRRRRRVQSPEKENLLSGPTKEGLVELIEFKLSLCPEFIIKLDADQSPVSVYVEQALRREKPLYLGIGATLIDRNSITDSAAAKRGVAELASSYAQAVKSVSESLALKGCTRAYLAWPGDVYIEDINAESDLELVKIIVEEVAKHGAIDQG